MPPAIGTQGRLGLSATSPVTYCLDFQNEQLRRKQETINGNGTRGTRSHTVERVRAGLNRIDGGVSLEPSAADWHVLLPLILGSAGAVVSGTNKRYDLAETVPSNYITIDRHGKVYTYTTAAVNSATIRAQQGELLSCELDLLACTETVASAGTFPAIYPDVTTNPLTFASCTLSVNSTTVLAKNFEITVNNDLDKDRFFNSNNLSAIVSRDRKVYFKTNLPYGDYLALYDTGADTGVAVLVTCTQGTTTLIFSMQKVVFAPMSPHVEGRVEVMLELEGQAFRFGTQTDTTKNEIIAQLDTGA